MIPYYWHPGFLAVLLQFQESLFSQSQSDLCVYVKTTAFCLIPIPIPFFLSFIYQLLTTEDRNNNILAETWRAIWVLSVLGPCPYGTYILIDEIDSKQVNYIY